MQQQLLRAHVIFNGEQPHSNAKQGSNN